MSAASGRPIPDVPVRLLRVAPGDTAAFPADTAAIGAARTGRDGVFTLVAPDTGVYRARIGDDFMGSVVHLASVDTLDAREYRLRMPDGGALYEFEVEKQAGLRGPLVARYPALLQSSNPLFTQAVRDGLLAAQFFPAEVGGRHVRQLVKIPVTFTVATPCVPPSLFGTPQRGDPRTYPSPFPGALP